MTTEVPRRLFTREEYHRMAEVGILSEDDRVELIHGEILQMSPIGDFHAAIVSRLNTLLTPLLLPQYLVNVQNPVHIGNRSEPEPDISVLPFREDYYAQGGVKAEHVLLLIEVSDSTGRRSALRIDRQIKLPLYATAGIPEVWIVDVGRKRLEVYHQPKNGYYGQSSVLEREDRVSATQLSLEVRVKEIIG